MFIVNSFPHFERVMHSCYSKTLFYCFTILLHIDEILDDDDETKTDVKQEESDNQMTVVDDVDNSPSVSLSKHASRSRSQSRSSYSSNKSGKNCTTYLIFFPYRNAVMNFAFSIWGIL